MKTTDPFGTELIERYLRTRGRQHFHGQHDGEYFFILKTKHGSLHVHLEIPPTAQDTLTIRVTPTRFFPRGRRRLLIRLATRWNHSAEKAQAVVYRSSDPSRVGVAAQSSLLVGRRIGFDDFAVYVDHTIASAVELFGEITSPDELPGPRRGQPELRNAG